LSVVVFNPVWGSDSEIGASRVVSDTLVYSCLDCMVADHATLM